MLAFVRMNVSDRQEKVLALLRDRGSVRVNDLAREFGVSQVTMRRDVEALARQGAVRRSHGVAYAADRGVDRSGAPAGARRGGDATSTVAPEPGRVSRPTVIGMVVPTSAYYYADVIRGVRSAVSTADARLVLGLSNYDADEEHEQVRQLLARKVDGLLITPAWPTGVAPAGPSGIERALSVPAVLIERRGEIASAVSELDRVCSDHAHGAYLAVRHFVGLGRRKVGLIARQSPTASQLVIGYRAALAQLDLPGPADAVRILSLQPELGDLEDVARAVAELVARHELDSALVHTDRDAVQLVQRLQQLGVRIPDDISVIAYDDEIAALADPPLTAIAPVKFAVGQAAARLLLARIGERRRGVTGLADPRHHLDLLPELRVRDS